MRVTLASVSARQGRSSGTAADAMVKDYVARTARLCPAETSVFEAEAALLASCARASGRAGALLVLFDSTGEAVTSEEFARWIAKARDDGAQRIIFAVGPADGWSAVARGAAARTFSFGRMTLPHGLARVVAAEQIYRAFTILAGHPYHCGH